MSLADEFLRDLDDLEDELGFENLQSSDDHSDNDTHDHSDDDEGLTAQSFANLILAAHPSVGRTGKSHLLASNKITLLEHSIHSVDATSLGDDPMIIDQSSHTKSNSLTEHRSRYQLMVECNSISVEIDNEVAALFKYIRDRYSKRFPELEQQVPNALDYARVILKLRNDTDVTNVSDSLSEILPAAIVMAVSVTGSTTAGTPLSDTALRDVLTASNEMLQLDDARNRLLSFVQGQMTVVAPNLSALVGTSIAAKLVSIAGGLSILSGMPSNVIQQLGKSARTLHGFSSVHARPQTSYLWSADVITRCPPSLRVKAMRALCGKVALAARCGAQRSGVKVESSSESGAAGIMYLKGIQRLIEKWNEPPPAKQDKPLPAPIDQPKKRRGGRRARRLKEKYGQTSELNKQANRMTFGKKEDEIGFDGEGISLGMLSGGGSGRGSVRLGIKDQKLMKKHHAKMARNAAVANAAASSTLGLKSNAWNSGGLTGLGGGRSVIPSLADIGRRDDHPSGMSTSLDLSTAKGLELPAGPAGGYKSVIPGASASANAINKMAAAAAITDGKDTVKKRNYFDINSGYGDFSMPPPMNKSMK